MAVQAVLGNRLTRITYPAGLTDEEVAGRAGISRAQLNRIRNGRAIPRVATALALASALGCRVRDVFYLKAVLPGRGAPRPGSPR